MKNNQVEEWKAQGNVLYVDFEDGTRVYFKQPLRKEMKLIMSKGAQGVVAMTDAFITNCYLGGDVTAEMLKSDEGVSYHTQLTASIDDLLGTKKLEVKKL
jgi:hypothetical protein